MNRLFAAMASALIAVALTLALASGAQAASYYNIVNQQTGKALEATTSGVRLAPLKRTNPLQQWKRINSEPFASWFTAGIKNRLLGCLRTDSTTFGHFAAPLGLGTCADPNNARERWYHLSGSDTATPDMPGYQLVSVQTVEYITDFCFLNCEQNYPAIVFEASTVAHDPQELGGLAKWRYRFAESAP